MAIREGAWDCPQCGRKRNRGPQKHCTGCGVPRDVSVPFYLPEDAPEVVAEAEKRQAAAGPDWTCTFCSGANAGDAQFCGNCGVDRRDLAMTRKVTETRTAPTAAAAVAAPAAKAASGWCCSVGCATVLLVILLMIWMGRPVERGLRITGHQWQRTVNTEVFKTVTEDAWEGELPPGARRRSSRREVHHVNKIQRGYDTRQVSREVKTGTRKVKVGTKDLGNGYFEDVFEEKPIFKTVRETVREPRYVDEPVYRTKHVYEIEKWVPGSPLMAQGRDLAPVWPQLRQARDNRERDRQQTYKILFADDKGQTYELETTDEADWRARADGSRVKAKVSGSRVVEILP